MTAAAPRPTGSRRAASRLRRPPGEASPKRLLTLTVVDQGASSVSNFLLSVVVAHYSGARPLGIFALAMSTYVIAQGLIRAFTSDCLLTRGEGDGPSLDRFRRGGYVAAALLGVVIGAGVAAAGTIVTKDLRLPLFLLGLSLPGLAMQDFSRYVGIHRRDPAYAIRLDMAWLVLFVGAALALRGWGLTSLPWLFGAWTATGAAVGLCTARPLALPGRGRLLRFWARNERTVGTHFAGQFLVSSITNYLIFYLLVLFVISVPTVGVIKLALLALGPATVMTAGLQIGIMPLAATRVASGQGTAMRFLAWAGVGMGALVALSAAVVYAVPAGALRSVLGPAWPQARPLIPLAGAALAVMAASGAAGCGLRVLRASRALLGTTIGLLPVVVVGPLAGAAADGAHGYVVGALAASVVYTVAMWVVLVRADRAARLARAGDAVAAPPPSPISALLAASGAPPVPPPPGRRSGSPGEAERLGRIGPEVRCQLGAVLATVFGSPGSVSATAGTGADGVGATAGAVLSAV